MKRGLALILVVGLLGVLAVLGTAFMILSRLERQAVRQRVLASKAALLARSGLEDAVARLCNGQDPSAKWLRYGGEDWNDDGALDAFESQQEVFRPGKMNKVDCPVRQALRPSFFVSDPSGAPKYLPLDGRQRGYSGRLPGDSASQEMVYTLKVEDESGKINVNGGFLDALDREPDGIPDHRDTSVPAPNPPPPIPPYPVFLGKQRGFVPTVFLNNLGIELGISTLGTRILQNRPLGGYRSIEEVKTLIGATTDLSPYLTVSSWVDRKVIEPTGYIQIPAGTPWCESDLKKLRLRPSLSETGRPPVNLNAAPRALIAAILRSNALDSVCSADPTSPYYVRFPTPLARAVADAFIVWRESRPFDTWNDFSEFCDSLVPTCISGMNVFNTSPLSGCPVPTNLAWADLIKANFNPNTDSAKEIPDRLAWKWIDKNDLTRGVLEGSLGPTGAFRASSIGRVLGRDGRVLAQAEAGCTLEAFRMFRQTTQKDFVGGRRLWEDSVLEPRYLSLASLPHRTNGASAGSVWWGNGAPPGRGLAVMTGPEPAMALAAGRASDYDGYVSLATMEMDPADPDSATLLFLHHFDDSWDADLGGARLSGTWDSGLQANVQQSVWPAVGVEPNTLYGDGAHLLPWRGPGWDSDPSFPEFSSGGNRAVLGFWTKIASMAFYAQPVFVSAARHVGGSNLEQDTQVFAIGGANDIWGCVVEAKGAIEGMPADGFPACERQASVDHRDPGHQASWPGLRWQLVTALFDTNESTLNEGLLFHARNAKGPGLEDPIAAARWGPLAYSRPLNQGTNTDLFQPGVPFSLGGDRVAFHDGSREDEILDEFAVCDFGDAAGAALDRFDAWRTHLWADGRYYKGDDGFFLSTRIEPEPGMPVTVLTARWTEYLPRDRRQEIYNEEHTDPDTGSFMASPDQGQDRFLDPRLARSRLELELLEEDGVTSLQPFTQGGSISRRLQGFRYKVRFKTDVRNPSDGSPDPLNQPALETPIFDDITFYYQRPGGARFLDWGRP